MLLLALLIFILLSTTIKDTTIKTTIEERARAVLGTSAGASCDDGVCATCRIDGVDCVCFDELCQCGEKKIAKEECTLT